MSFILVFVLYSYICTFVDCGSSSSYLVFFLSQVSVDGNKYHHFKHRIPIERVRTLHIAGDVRIETVNVLGVRTLIYVDALSLAVVNTHAPVS